MALAPPKFAFQGSQAEMNALVRRVLVNQVHAVRSLGNNIALAKLTHDSQRWKTAYRCCCHKFIRDHWCTGLGSSIGPGASIGPGTRVGPGGSIGLGASIGPGTREGCHYILILCMAW